MRKTDLVLLCLCILAFELPLYSQSSASNEFPVYTITAYTNNKHRLRGLKKYEINSVAVLCSLPSHMPKYAIL